MCNMQELSLEGLSYSMVSVIIIVNSQASTCTPSSHVFKGSLSQKLRKPMYVGSDKKQHHRRILHSRLTSSK